MYRTFNNSNYSRNEKTDEELNREKLNDPEYCRERSLKLVKDDKLIHMLKHHGVQELVIYLENSIVQLNLELYPCKKNLECGYCKDHNNLAKKYEMVHNYLKTKIGPDCSRLVVYKTVEMDNKNDTDWKKHTYNIIYGYITQNNEHRQLLRDHPRQIRNLSIVAFHNGEGHSVSLPC